MVGHIGEHGPQQHDHEGLGDTGAEKQPCTAAGPATGRKNSAAAVNSSTARHSPEKLMSRPRTSTHHSMAAARTISTPVVHNGERHEGHGGRIARGTPFTAPMAKL